MNMSTELIEVDGEDITEVQATTLEQITRGEYDVQIATAKKYPRSTKKFIHSATELSCYSEEVASECLYALKRSGKTIEGPSARFSEIIASAWGNCRAASRVVGEDDKFVTAQGIFFDLEKNVAITTEVRRRITDREGRKYADDMVGVTSNAACSIAMRNAVLKGIPKAIWDGIYKQARQCAIGSVQTLQDKRLKSIEYFGKMGVTSPQIMQYLGVDGVEDITLDHLAILKGLVTRLKDGESVEAVFAEEKSDPITTTRKVKASAIKIGVEGGET